MDDASFDLIQASLRGALDLKTTDLGVSPVRLPAWTSEQFDSPQLDWIASQGSGVHLDITTTASWIEIEISTTRLLYPNMPPAAFPTVVAATLDKRELPPVSSTDGPYRLMASPDDVTFVPGEATLARFDLGMADSHEKQVSIWLPNNASVDIRAIRADRSLRPAPRATTPNWFHYGSSISHCAEADTPLGVWPVAAAEKLGANVTNLGLGANAHLDQFIARTLRDSDADLISMKVGINIVNADSLKRRTFIPALHGFLDTIREGKPDTPLLLVSPISCPMQEDTAGPIMFDARLMRLAPTREPAGGRPYPDGALTLQATREIIEDTVQRRSAADPNLFYLDGRELFGPDDVDDLPDGLHPSPAGYQRMAARFVDAEIVNAWIGALRARA